MRRTQEVTLLLTSLMMWCGPIRKYFDSSRLSMLPIRLSLCFYFLSLGLVAQVQSTRCVDTLIVKSPFVLKASFSHANVPCWEVTYFHWRRRRKMNSTLEPDNSPALVKTGKWAGVLPSLCQAWKIQPSSYWQTNAPLICFSSTCVWRGSKNRLFVNPNWSLDSISTVGVLDGSESSELEALLWQIMPVVPALKAVAVSQTHILVEREPCQPGLWPWRRGFHDVANSWAFTPPRPWGRNFPALLELLWAIFSCRNSTTFKDRAGRRVISAGVCLHATRWRDALRKRCLNVKSQAVGCWGFI